MPDPQVANVLKTGALLYYAPVGETQPDETSVDYGDAWGGNWARVGYTTAPLTAAYESSEFDIEVEEVLAPINRFRNSEGLMLETTLGELIADLMSLSSGGQDTVTEVSAGASQKAYEETGLGGVAKIDKKAWGFEGMFVTSDGDVEPVRIFVHKATAMINGELTFSQKDDNVSGAIPVQIKALADTTQDAGQELMLFQRVTAEATA